MKKALVSPLKEIDKIFDLVSSYIDESSEITTEVLENIAKIEELTIIEHKSSQKYASEVKEKIKILLRKLYEPTKKHV